MFLAICLSSFSSSTLSSYIKLKLKNLSSRVAGCVALTGRLTSNLPSISISVNLLTHWLTKASNVFQLKNLLVCQKPYSKNCLKSELGIWSSITSGMPYTVWGCATRPGYLLIDCSRYLSSAYTSLKIFRLTVSIKHFDIISFAIESSTVIPCVLARARSVV